MLTHSLARAFPRGITAFLSHKSIGKIKEELWAKWKVNEHCYFVFPMLENSYFIQPIFVEHLLCSDRVLGPGDLKINDTSLPMQSCQVPGRADITSIQRQWRPPQRGVGWWEGTKRGCGTLRGGLLRRKAAGWYLNTGVLVRKIKEKGVLRSEDHMYKGTSTELGGRDGSCWNVQSGRYEAAEANRGYF